MSKRALNAVMKPTPAPQGNSIPLKPSQQMAVELIVSKENLLLQQQAQFMRVQAETAKQKTTLLAEIEKDFKLPEGSILRGEWAIMGGAVVKQGK
jgi:hypothetical protein